MNRDIAGVYLLKSISKKPTGAKPVKTYSQQLATIAKSIRDNGVAHIIKSQMAFDFSAPLPPSKYKEDRMARQERGHNMHKAIAHPAMLKSRKLHGSINFNGLDISIETGRSRCREWYNPHDGSQGISRMTLPYGYIKRSQGVDGDHYDVFVGPDHSAPEVYIVTTMKAPDFTGIDEEKAFLGVNSAEEAERYFKLSYSDERFFGGITAMPFDEFKEKVLATKDEPVLLGDIKKSGEAMCKQIGDKLGVNWKEIDLDEFCDGMLHEEEHKDVTGGSAEKTAKIVLVHLKEDPKYYSKLEQAGL